MDELNSIEKYRVGLDLDSEQKFKHPAAVHIIGGKAVDLLDE